MVIVCKYTHMHIYIYDNHTMSNHIANTYTHLFNLNKYILGGLKS
jgi:CRISPR/Cas system CSM-associated protein Csm3 (group 7 of RAMP superfamily)